MWWCGINFLFGDIHIWEKVWLRPHIIYIKNLNMKILKINEILMSQFYENLTKYHKYWIKV